MDNNNSPAQQSKQESLQRGVAFQQLIKSDGWKFVKAYFENRVKVMATQLLLEDKPIVEFENERRELIGLRKLLGYIENDIKILEDESKKDTRVAK